MPWRYSPSQTNDSSSNRRVSRSSMLLLETPSLTSFQVNGSLRNISFVCISSPAPYCFISRRESGQLDSSSQFAHQENGTCCLLFRREKRLVSNPGRFSQDPRLTRKREESHISPLCRSTR